MGHTRWDSVASSTYATNEAFRTLRGVRDVTSYTMSVRSGEVAPQVHQLLNPLHATRESRDSDAHPASVAIGVLFDHTGSMGMIPRTLQRRLPRLMTLLTDHVYVTDPQILFGAIGDAYVDQGPVQVGQFESGVEMDGDLDRIWVYGGGGGGHRESYELGHYFFARHTVTDCWEKRQKKGYLFTIGDEMPYAMVHAEQIRALFGDGAQEDISTAAIITELATRWNVFHLLADTQTSRSNPDIAECWRQLLPPAHVVPMRQPDTVGELIGAIIGICEGVETVQSDLAAMGADADALRDISVALAPVAVSRGIRLTA